MESIMATTYRITDDSGNQAIDAGSDLGLARQLAQSYADRWNAPAYLYEHGHEMQFDTFDPELPDCLYDSDTNEYLSAEDLGLSDSEYADACRESTLQMAAEGHIKLASGRRVYANF